MIRPVLLGTALSLVGCSTAETIEPEVCSGLSIRVLDQAIAPPANVAALVRVGECDGKPLALRLDERAFVLSENSVPLSVHEATRQIIPAERQRAQRTLLALDLSGSIVRAGLRPSMIEGARSLIDALDPTHDIAVFGFDGRPDLLPFAFFTSDRAALASALDRAAEAPLVDDSTNLNGAIVSALTVLDRAVETEEKDRDQVAHGSFVVFTDGRDLAHRVSADEVDEALDETEHSSFAIGVGADVDPAELTAIGRTEAAIAGGAEEVAGAFLEVAAALEDRAESDYVVSYCSPARAGRRTLEIRVQDGDRSASAEIDFDADGFGAGCAPEATPLR